MIIIDLNQVMISNFMAQVGAHTNIEINEGLFRHMVLNQIRSLRTKFNDYGEVIIACDDKKSWRRDVFPYYKASRRKDRQKSEIDWPTVFNSLSAIKAELKEFFPYRVIQVEGAEADDVIGTLCHKFGNIINTGEQILILSGDKDFAQLHVYGNVKQFDPVRKKHIKHADPLKFTRELIFKGDRGDGIPNILSEDNVLADGIRQRPVRLARFATISDPGSELEGEELRGWKRNEMLIDLAFTPQNIQDQIMSIYDSEAGKDRSKLFNYFVSKKLTSLVEQISEF